VDFEVEQGGGVHQQHNRLVRLVFGSDHQDILRHLKVLVAEGFEALLERDSSAGSLGTAATESPI
jgi:hypothetical protein